MATKSMKKTSTKDADAVEAINIVEESTTVVETVEPVTTVKMQKKKFEATEPIECVSITSGELGMIGIKSGINYTWAGRGDVTEVEYQDLVSAIRSSKNHIYKPYFIIQNEEFLAEFPQVKKVYAAMYTIQDLKSVFNLSPAQMKNAINSLPEGAKESIKHIAADMIQRGTLDSVQKIRALDEIYDTKFMLMTQLFNA